MESVSYLVGSVATDSHDYYCGSSVAGRWIGSGTTSFALTGSVDAQPFVNLLEGLSPIDGTPLAAVRPGRPRSVLGWDFTFSAPKSVSVAWAIGTPETRDGVLAAHEAATQQAITWLERHAARSRAGNGGQRVIEISGFVGGCFQHGTSRAGDPQLHSHVAVANLVQTLQGEWRTLYGARLFAYAKTCGYVYQAVLRHELRQRFDITFRPVANGAADIDEVPDDLCLLWSKRRAEIVARAQELSFDSARSRQLIAYATRAAKPAGVESQWEAMESRWLDEADGERVTFRRRTNAAEEPEALAVEELPAATDHLDLWLRVARASAGSSLEVLEARTQKALRTHYRPIERGVDGPVMRLAGGRLVKVDGNAWFERIAQ